MAGDDRVEEPADTTDAAVAIEAMRQMEAAAAATANELTSDDQMHEANAAALVGAAVVADAAAVSGVVAPSAEAGVAATGAGAADASGAGAADAEPMVAERGDGVEGAEGASSGAEGAAGAEGVAGAEGAAGAAGAEGAEGAEHGPAVKRRKVPCKLWQHFEKQGPLTLCLECVRAGKVDPKLFSANTGVSSLTSHLKTKHGIGGPVGPTKAAAKAAAAAVAKARRLLPGHRRMVVLEVGSGADLHGQNATEAACRACRAAIEFNSLPILKRLCDGGGLGNMLVRIKLGVPQEFMKAVNVEMVKACFPYGDKDVEIVVGGLVADSGICLPGQNDKEGDTRAVVVVAAVEVHC